MVHQNVAWLDVLVDQACDGLGRLLSPSNGNAQERVSRAVAPVPIRIDPWLAARVLEYENRPPFVTRESLRLGATRIKVGCERYSCSSRLRLAGIGCSAMAPVLGPGKGCRVAAAVKDELPAFSQRLQHVSGRFRHGGRRSTNASPPQRTPFGKRLVGQRQWSGAIAAGHGERPLITDL